MTSNPEHAFDDLVNDLKGPLYGYLLKMVRNSTDAEDLLQEAFIRIHKGLPNLEKKDKLKSWAFRIATNVAIDSIRKNQKVQIVEFDESLDPVEFDELDKPILDEMTDCASGTLSNRTRGMMNY